MLTSTSSLQTITVLLQGFLLLVVCGLLLVFCTDLLVLYHRACAYRQRAQRRRAHTNYLLSLGTIWKPK